MATIIVTLLGEDKPGLVDHLSEVVSAHGGNWEQSRMAHLGGKFAGVLLASVAPERANALRNALRRLEHEDALHLTAELTESSAVTAGAQQLDISLTGNDRLGIVHAITHALAERLVNIELFESEVVSASMGGGVLFNAHIVATAPRGVSVPELQADLEALANEMMVDVELQPENDA